MLSDDASPDKESQPPSSVPRVERRSNWRRNEDRKLHQRERELEAARRICQALEQLIKVDELVEQALRTALDVVGAEAGSILLANVDDKQLVFRYVIGAKSTILHGTAIPWDKGIAGAVFQSGEPTIISDAGHDVRHFHDIDNSTGFQTRDMIVLPLRRWGGETLGVLEILNKRHGRLDSDDVGILTIVSALSAQAIQQAQVSEEAKLAEVVHLLGNLWHDLKNMLVPIVMGAEMMETEINGLFEKRPQLLTEEEGQICHNACLNVLGI